MDESEILREILEQLKKSGVPFNNDKLSNIMKDYENGLLTQNKSLKQITDSLGKYRTSMNVGTKNIRDMGGIIGHLNDSLKELGDSATELEKSQTRAQIRALEKEFTKAQASDAAKKGLVELGKAAVTASLAMTKSVYTNLTGTASGFKIAGDAMIAEIDFANQSMNALANAGSAVGAGLTMMKGRFAVAGVALGATVEGLKFLNTALSEAAKFSISLLVQEADKMVTSFQSMSASGAIFANGMDDMREAATANNLTQEQMASVLKNNNELFAQSGITIGQAVTQLGKVGTVLKTSKLSDNMLKMGFSFEDMTAMSAQIVADQRKYGIAFDANKVAQATEAYAKNLRIIADITGEDGKKKMDEARKETELYAFRAKVAEIAKSTGQDASKLYEDITQRLALMDPMTRRAFMQMTISGATTEKAAYLQEGYVDAIGASVDAFKKGQTGMDAVLKYNDENKGKFNDTIVAISMASAMGATSMKEAADNLNQLSLNMLKVNSANLAQAEADVAKLLEEKKKAEDGRKSLTDTVVDVQKQAQAMKMVIQDELTKNLHDFSQVVQQVLTTIQRQLKTAGYVFETGQFAGQSPAKAANAVQSTADTILGAVDDALSLGGLVKRPFGTPSASELPKKALGDPATNGPVIAGEKGPEAIIPLPDGRTVPTNIDLTPLTRIMNEFVDIAKDQRDIQTKLLNNSY